jgi:DNA replication and repair protein RecF
MTAEMTAPFAGAERHESADAPAPAHADPRPPSVAPGRAPERAPEAAAGAGRLAVMRLRLAEFRSYATAEIAVDARPVVLTGPNGAGKTNLIEAVSLLAPGRGLRRARLAEIDRRGAPAVAAWAVAAEIETPDGARRLGTGRDPARGAAEGERRLARIDGAPARSAAALGAVVHLLWLTPEQDRLFADGAGDRRRFLDRIVLGFAPDHARRLAAYERALAERGRLLEAGTADPAWLAALERQMAENGVAVAAARRDIALRLAHAVESGTGAFPAPALAPVGDVEADLETLPALAAEDALAERLAAGRAADAAAGRALAGPHRSDLAVRHRDKDMPAALCSTGEQKALLIALVLGAARLIRARRGAPPLLLLDEIAAHLDRVRRAALFDEIAALGAQAWMTGTDAALFEALGERAQFLAVADGAVTGAGTPA